MKKTLGLVALTLAVACLPVSIADAKPASTQAAAAETVLLASGASFPDALAAGVLSFAYQAPVLLTQRDALPPSVAAEIRRRGTPRVIILGGEMAVGPKVIEALHGLGITDIERVAGNSRYDTAAAIAARSVSALGQAANARAREIKSIVDDSFAELQVQIDALGLELAEVETDVVVLTASVESAETTLSAVAHDVLGLTARIQSIEASSGADSFWPVESLQPHVRVDAYTGPASLPALSEIYVNVDLRGSIDGMDSQVVGADKVVMIVTFEGQRYGVAGPHWGYPSGDSKPVEGTPITVEYWYQAYGAQGHDTVTVADWTYTEW